MLWLEHVSKTFNTGTINERKALIDAQLHIAPGEFVTVIGGNGAGKSTILNAIAGTWPIDDGAIILDGINVTGLPEHKRAPFIGRVFQDPKMGTAADMQIEENLALARRRGQKRGLKWGVTKAEREEFKEKLAILGLGLEDRMTSKVGLLSGGQRQALTLLMAALMKPKLLLLDEHTAALDPATAAKVLIGGKQNGRRWIYSIRKHMAHAQIPLPGKVGRPGNVFPGSHGSRCSVRRNQVPYRR